MPYLNHNTEDTWQKLLFDKLMRVEDKLDRLLVLQEKYVDTTVRPPLKPEYLHRSMKNVIKLNHYFCPSELEKAIDGWVKYYNERRFHESLDNLTPRDVYLGQGEKIKKIREIIKQNSINKRISENKRMILQHK